MSDLIQTAITRTVAYSNHFSFPLTLPEIHTRLVGSLTNRSQLILHLNTMIKNHSICRTGDYYHFPGREKLVSRRLHHARLSVPEFAKAQDLALKLARIPGVLAIYLTGSLAMKNSNENSDIDFMVITHNSRLWTTRLLLTLYTSLLGLRRTPHSRRNQGLLCLNLYLSPRSYLLPPDRRSLYTAYELVQAQPLFDPHNTRSQLLSRNSWIKNYLPNVILGSVSPRSDQLGRRPKGAFGRLQNTIMRPGQTLLELIEFSCYHLQFWYMRPKLTREYVTPDVAFFHPNNPSPRV